MNFPPGNNLFLSAVLALLLCVFFPSPISLRLKATSSARLPIFTRKFLFTFLFLNKNSKAVTILDFT